MKKIKIISTILISILIVLSVLLLFNLLSKPTPTYQIISSDDSSVTISVAIEDKSLIDKPYFVAIDNNPQTDINTAWKVYSPADTYTLTPGNYYIHIKDNLDNVISTDSIINSTISINIDDLKYPFYPIGEQIDLSYDILTYGVDPDFSITSSNEDVAYIENNKIITKAVGTSTITISSSDLSESIDLEVTDLYTLADTDSMSKPVLNKTICDEAQAHKLDEVLKLQIEEAGYHTRAGVVAAARFLTLQFPYRLAYFAESGKLDQTNDPRRSDGEGRYYHEGLYLSEDKYDDIVASIYGPKYWGLFFREDTTEDHSRDEEYLSGVLQVSDIGSSLYLMKRPNGLDCGGFVSWCYYNAGFDLGDMGAGGPGSYGMSILGERVNITDELLQSDRIKAGDLCGYAGHVGIVVGVEEDYIWIADTLITGTKVSKYERSVESFNRLGKESFQYFMLMDEEYIEDGNYTPMW